MLRYLKAVQQMKQILEDNDLVCSFRTSFNTYYSHQRSSRQHVMATTARYVCSYALIEKQEWWTKSLTCGPIVEQATHFCDLSRYFGGEVDIPSVQAHSLEF